MGFRKPYGSAMDVTRVDGVRKASALPAVLIIPDCILKFLKGIFLFLKLGHSLICSHVTECDGHEKLV